jgi:hypothetical protein
MRKVKKKERNLCTVAHTYNPRSWEPEAGRSQVGQGRKEKKRE